MNVRELHGWDLTPDAARKLQEELAPQVVRAGGPTEVRAVAGIDVGLPAVGPAGERVARAAVVLDRYPELTPIESISADRPLTFPYVPGLLSFREIPAIIAACRALPVEPDLIIVDGHGIAHPRHLGIASHVGLLLDKPTIGCAKSLLAGHAEPVGPNRGDWVPIVYRREVVGAVLRTRPGVNPVYVSTGHQIDLPSAIHWVLACTGRYRLPEPQRQAHRRAG
jgi:deoxyribonuclease V